MDAQATVHELALCRIASGRPQARRWAVEIARDALGTNDEEREDDEDDDRRD